MKLRIKELQERTLLTGNEQAYKETMKAGSIVGEFLEISPQAYRTLLIKYKPQQTVTGSCCMPSVAQMANNAFKSVTNIVSASLTGNKVLASSELKKQRELICESCEYLNLENNRCLKCGCFYKSKSTFQTEKCPISKW